MTISFLLAAIFSSACAAGFGIALIPNTSSVFDVLGREGAGPVVAAIFQKYAIWQAAFLSLAAGSHLFLSQKSMLPAWVLIASLTAVVLHGGWELNRRTVQSVKQEIAQYESRDQAPQELRKKFGQAHAISVALLLLIIGLSILASLGSIYSLTPALQTAKIGQTHDASC